MQLYHDPISGRKAVLHAPVYRANNVCYSPEILAKEMDYLLRVLIKNSYPYWMIKESGKNQQLLS